MGSYRGEVRDGKVEEGGKQRTRSKALAFLVDTLANAGPVENLMVLSADCSDVDAFVEAGADPAHLGLGDPGLDPHRGDEVIDLARTNLTSPVVLAFVLGLVARGQMAVTIEEQAGWNEAPAVAQRLLDRKFSGKAVLLL